MRPIAPRIDGAEEFTIAENQLQYAPIVACLIKDSEGTPMRVCRWTLSAEERQRVAEGEDIYIMTLARIPLLPHSLSVGIDLLQGD